MDTEKATDVEMKELSPAEVQDDKDAEKDKKEGTKEIEKEVKEEEKKGKEIKEEEKSNVYSSLTQKTEDIYNTSTSTSAPKPSEEAEKKSEEKEEKEKEIKEDEGNVYSKLTKPTEDIYNPSMSTSAPKSKKAEKEEGKGNDDEEGEETNLYCKLNTPSENIYMSAAGSTSKQNKDAQRKFLLCKRISAVFIILSVILLAVVIALALKSQTTLHEVQPCEKCVNVTTEVKIPTIPVHRFSECGKGWIKRHSSCYFISSQRLTWPGSRKKCRKMGGDLVVINTSDVQKLLTNTRMMYWIGLRFSENQQWVWIDNTTLTRNTMFWAESQPDTTSQKFCTLLRGMTAHQTNWITNHCENWSYFICQKG